MSDLNSLRAQIDAIDSELVAKLQERIRLAAEVGRVKRSQGSAIFAPGREEQVFARIQKAAGPDSLLSPKAQRAIWREIISAMIALEAEITIAYLGPEGTFTEQAAHKHFGSSLMYEPMRTIADVFMAVERGEADYGVVPIENSTEGAVIHALDMLAGTELKIVAESYLPIEHCLLSRSPLEAITVVHSKDQALGQCRDWLRRHLPEAQLIDCESTARAVQIAKEREGVAAIAGALASERYAVPLVRKAIQDRSDNVTRFFVIGAGQGGKPLGQDRDKTSILIALKDEVGALEKAVSAFSQRAINLCKIESRPNRQRAWEYHFFIDIEGHWEDPPVKEAIAELEKICVLVKWLGSFPKMR
ncbi:MAG: prephenate dehydratase [Opitutales bacterium]